jgi:G3E family GTPase
LSTQTKLQEVKDVLADLNAAARILETSNAAVDLRLLLDVGMFQLERLMQQTEQGGQHSDQLIVLDQQYNGHLHEDDISSVSFVSDRPFDYDKFGQFMQNLPSGIFRGKGILWIDGYEEKLVFHLVGDRSQAVAVGDWGNERENKLVLIGKGLDRGSILATLEACLCRVGF